MTKIIPGLHVGSFIEANYLFSAKNDSKTDDDGRKKDSEPDSIDNVKEAVITVCQDVPYWCSTHCSKSTTHFSILNESLSKLYHDHVKNPYVNLHFDLVYRRVSDDDEFEAEPTYVVHSIIDADDKPDETFFMAFKFSYELIDYFLSIEKGFVLVHCMLGLCRSTSLICSYLMRKWNKRFMDVKRYMKQVHPKTAISHYFEYQMILYYKNGFRIEDEGFFYNHYMKTLDNYLMNRHNLSFNLDTDPDPQFVYSCKVCRETLFCDNNIIRHDADPGTPGRALSSSDDCNSIFIEPMTWMKELESPNGKLFCSNSRCNSKLGSFSWHGRKCSCGHLQVPAFQVQLSKVDRFNYSDGSHLPGKDSNLQVK
ncbi:dual-specificity phosphatase [Theileria orientalis strain Shintoku]|uniref:protein-tyrosine-phosphatase n=1 Tax=Theileria orientalis strain Shintoku TaxID=869250 RepID=J4D7C5_THEOR|nr:dual-specificity phosphatase [Theileria orientalis strain Shintoku]PVC51121.1 dual-specificity phosphatase [Theileria orientalis]BAM40100.1 dual-specificity phosphatase [Theileria orientalis strain Shintoku]|eukprot:XP_009690401.1 dual-specificity phosphatase [Theileria orientalis strain Shintoku]